MRRHITPNYVTFNSRVSSSSACKALRVARRVWIKEEVKKHYFKLNLIELKLKSIYLKVTYALHPLEFDSLTSRLLDYIEDQGKIKFDRLFNKIQQLSIKHNNLHSINNSHNNSNLNLLNSTSLNNTYFFNDTFCNEFDVSDCVKNGKFSDFRFHNRFLNLSSVTLDGGDEEVLNLGLRFNFFFKPKPTDLQLLAVESERILEISNLEDRNVVRSQIAVCLNRYHNSTRNLNPFNKNINRNLTNLRKKIVDNNLIVSKADKGNCIVIMDKILYLDKVEDFLSSDDFSSITTNPTPSFFIYLKKILSITNDTLNFLNSDKSKLYPMNPQTPLLYGLPKIHKANIPIRPVVSYSNSPAYKLASWLNHIILSLTNFSSKYSVNNTFQFTNRLKDIFIPENSMLVSFDVKNLFPSIPPEDCIRLLRKLLFDRTNIPTHHILNLCLLVDTVLRQNFFQFNQQFYSQQSGLAMGSPLSPLLSEIFMSELESLIEQHPLFTKLIHFSRYVDDTFVIFNGSLMELNMFLSFLNSLHPSIEFTMELENNESIPFLDVIVHKKNRQINFSIYHKPTSTDTVIPYHSNHPISHKLAAFNSFFHRLFNIPLNSQSFKSELNIIKQIAYNNNYPMYLINKVYYRHLSKFLNKNLLFPITDKQTTKYFSLPFFNNISYKIQDIFRRLNINISFRTSCSLKSFVVHTKDIIPPLEKSGVYLLKCSHPGCNTCYIGQSGRKMSTRITEHTKIIDKYKNNSNNDINSKSTFANHVINENHVFDIDTDAKVLHFCNKGVTLNLLEILEIYKALNDPNVNCINDQTNFSCLSFFSSLSFLRN